MVYEKKVKENEWYCVCCDRVLKSGFVNRHKKTEGHRHNEFLYRVKDIQNQIFERLIEDFNKGHYDVNDIKLVDKERLRRFKKLRKQEKDKFWNAWKVVNFDELELDEKIDFLDYNIYHKMRDEFGFRLRDPNDKTSDDSDSDDE